MNINNVQFYFDPAFQFPKEHGIIIVDEHDSAKGYQIAKNLTM